MHILAQKMTPVDEPFQPVEPSECNGEKRPLIIASTELLQGRRELWIEHGQELYRLRLTPSGKLYLTK